MKTRLVTLALLTLLISGCSTHSAYRNNLNTRMQNAHINRLIQDWGPPTSRHSENGVNVWTWVLTDQGFLSGESRFRQGYYPNRYACQFNVSLTPNNTITYINTIGGNCPTMPDQSLVALWSVASLLLLIISITADE